MRIPKLNHYRDIVGEKIIEDIEKDASTLDGKSVTHINSTYYGGGVAEILNTLVPLFNDIGIETGWRSIKGNPDFFAITKKFHNALQGDEINLTTTKKRIYEKTNEINSIFTHIEEHDCVIVHDPQPLPLINYYKKTKPWIWRCHIDLSDPNRDIWNYLKGFISKYDMTIVSKNSFRHRLNVPQRVIPPSIDPLNPKNMELPEKTVRKHLRRFNIDLDKPIISQVSRYDKWKDPCGVIEVYKRVKKKLDCQLVMLGSMATDDPEGQEIYNQVAANSRDDNIHLINFESDILVNAIQRTSAVVVQKSLREGFGLTVSEALWKKTPVVAGNVGGISLQVKNGYNGYLVNSIDSCAKAVAKILENPKLAKRMGERGHEHVKENFLITRHLHDYVTLLNKQLVNYKVEKNA